MGKTAISPFDEDLLRLELETLVSETFDVSLTGFDLDEIDRLLQGLEAAPAGLTRR